MFIYENMSSITSLIHFIICAKNSGKKVPQTRATHEDALFIYMRFLLIKLNSQYSERFPWNCPQRNRYYYMARPNIFRIKFISSKQHLPCRQCTPSIESSWDFIERAQGSRHAAKQYMTCTLSGIPQVITRFRFSRGDIIKYFSI